MSFMSDELLNQLFLLMWISSSGLPLDMMAYVGLTGKRNSGTRWAAISCSQGCLENRCHPLPASPTPFILLLSCTIFSAMPLQKLCCASGSVPSYLKAGADDDGSSSSSLSLCSSSPPLFNLWHGYACLLHSGVPIKLVCV